jgi:hypothetical protein
LTRTLLPALQHFVSGVLFLFTILKMHTVGQKFVTAWGYMADPLVFVVNKDIWNSWTPGDQAPVPTEVARTHSGLITAFSLHLVKTGLVRQL